MTDWILSCLLLLAGRVYPTDGAVPPPGDLLDLAEVIDAGAHSHPLPGDDGVVEAAVELAVLAETEGHLRVGAVGHDQFGHSYGPWQIHETTLFGYFNLAACPASFYVMRGFFPGTVPSLACVEVPLTVRLQAEYAAELVAKSHEVCSRRHAEEALGWYASGGPTCSVPEGLAASRYRVGLARWVRERNPVYWVDHTR